ncbi:MAG: MaoC-like dehydratase [Actinomycetia bacterium]|nr:MaoC-like dehydratase [Actinomycetes bacterium]
MTVPSYDEVEPGTEIPPKSYQLQRVDLVKYAGASGDFNIIHWNERVATQVGLPNVIAHGMLTMAQAGKFVTEWAGGDPGAVVDFGVRFSAMVPVPDDDAGATVVVSGKVGEKLGDNKVQIDLTARSGDTKVLSRSRAIVRLP